MNTFVQECCVQRELPGIYYQDAKFIPGSKKGNVSYAIMAINKALPDFKDGGDFYVDSYNSEDQFESKQ